MLLIIKILLNNIKLFFTIPTFPQPPSLSYRPGITDWIENDEHHLKVDSDVYNELVKKDEDVQEWCRQLKKVYVPWWWRFRCWIRRKPMYPTLPTPLQLALNSVPNIISRNTVADLTGSFELPDLSDKIIAEERSLIFDGGPEKSTIIDSGLKEERYAKD